MEQNLNNHLYTELDSILNKKVSPFPELVLNNDGGECSKKQPQGTGATSEAIWTGDATKLLLATVEELLPCVGNTFQMKTKKKMWTYVADTIMKQHSYNYTALQCQNRWKTLKRGYDKKMHNNLKADRIYKNCDYSRELENILKRKVTIIPEMISGGESEHSFRNHAIQNASLLDHTCNTDSASPALHTKSHKMSHTKTRKLTIAGELQQLRQQLGQRNKQLIQIARKKNKAYEERTAEMRRKNTLLEQLINLLNK